MDRRLGYRVTLGLLLLGLGFGAFAGLLIAPELDRGRPSPAAGLASEIAALREDIAKFELKVFQFMQGRKNILDKMTVQSKLFCQTH